MTGNAFLTLTSQHSTLILDCRETFPSVLYWGGVLCNNTTPEMLSLLSTRQEAPCSASTEPTINLTPTEGSGFLGQSGLRVHRQGTQWSAFPTITTVTNTRCDSNHHVTVTSHDHACGIALIHHISLDNSGVLALSTELINNADSVLSVEWCAAATMPIPAHIEQMITFEGRWAKEFQLQRIDRFKGTYLRENRTGRTSHDNFPGLIIVETKTTESNGEAYGFHLGWSSNHRMCSEVLPDGRGYVQMGELLLPGELQLQPGENYHSPTLYCAYSSKGLSALSQQYHHYFRKNICHERIKNKPRPIHYNTWEALYFNHSPSKLLTIADKAAAIGVERFVLDDGWFKGRRSDNAGLGDWTVDSQIYPEGLTPLVNHVKNRGMEFGLWVEPEMVNPDSDLYRKHPEWVLASSAPTVIARNQLVLNLSLKAVQEYLFQQIDALLTEYDITYIKWDMNRDIHQPGNNHGLPSAHRQVQSLYSLLNRIRVAHPTVEIESCASGGGRADYKILQHTDRVWTSDSNDALDRLSIQKGFSLFFPSSVMGSHVGPKTCHITGRKLDMSLRAAVALFGHMGLEVDLFELGEDDYNELKLAIDLHKQYRELIHNGDLFRLDTENWCYGFGIISTDKREALFSYTIIDGHTSNLPGRYRFQGLEINALYQINVIWPSKPSSSTKSILDCINDSVFSGEVLMKTGMQLPLILPESTLLFSLKMTNH